MHEESRLHEAYKEVYGDYQNSDIPFYLPDRILKSTRMLM
jgi:hypothetical protein